MESTTRNLIFDGLLRLLKPVARLLLAAGIGYREFAEISKKAFVSVASEDFGLRGRKTNLSRVAVMTGLTRKEVRRIRNELENVDYSLPLKRSPVNNVLTGWHTDQLFLDKNGKPLELDVESQSNAPDFLSLVKAYGGDIPPVALLKELERGGGVEYNDGRVKPLTRYFEPVSMDEEYLSSSFFSLTNLADTIQHNTIEDHSARYAERYVYSKCLTRESAERFRLVSEEKSWEFLNSLDDWLVGHEMEIGQERSAEENDRIVGVGIYYFHRKAGE